jgi:hypothetical protein
VIGFRLRPGAAGLLGVSADEITDKRLPLEAIWGRAATELAEQLAEQQSLELSAFVCAHGHL